MKKLAEIEVLFVIPNIDDELDGVKKMLYNQGIVCHVFGYNNPKITDDFRIEVDEFLSDINPTIAIHPPVTFNDNWIINSNKPYGIKALLKYLENKNIKLFEFNKFEYVGPWDDRVGFLHSPFLVAEELYSVIISNKH